MSLLVLLPHGFSRPAPNNEILKISGKNWVGNENFSTKASIRTAYLAAWSKNFLELNSLFLFIQRALVIVIGNIT